MSNTCNTRHCVISSVYPAGGLSVWPTVVHGENAIDGYRVQTLQQNSSIPAILIGAIDLFHFIPFSVALADGQSTGHLKAKPVGFIFLHTSQRDQDKIWYDVKMFKLNILILPESEIYIIKGNNYFFTDCIKKR